MPKRQSKSFVHAGTYTNRYDGSVDDKTAKTSYVNDSLLLGLNGHYGYPDFPPDRDVGGAFSLLTSRGSYGGAGVGTVHGQGAYAKHEYTGSVYSDSFEISPPAVITDGSSWGATAYNRMKPTKPVLPAANAFYEMREVPGMLQQKLAKSGMKNIGSYFLALKFGWQPLLSDIISMVNFQQKAQKKLRWLLRHNGKSVKTHYEVASSPSDPVITSGDFGNMQPGFVDYFYRRRNWKRMVTTFDKIWATAQFKFWLPPGPKDVTLGTSVGRRLFGLYPSPEFVWNALPWTWMADWFSNTGDLLANLDTGVADKLAANHFYVMRHIGKTYVHTNNATLYDLDDDLVPISVTTNIESSSKSRLRGDPFGWGTNPNTLNGTQLAIMGALGLSKL